MAWRTETRNGGSNWEARKRKLVQSIIRGPNKVHAGSLSPSVQFKGGLSLTRTSLLAALPKPGKFLKRVATFHCGKLCGSAWDTSPFLDCLSSYCKDYNYVLTSSEKCPLRVKMCEKNEIPTSQYRNIPKRTTRYFPIRAFSNDCMAGATQSPGHVMTAETGFFPDVPACQEP